MGKREEIENAIIHANLCLKRWAMERSHLLTYPNIRSLVNGWLVRVLSRGEDFPNRKSFTKKISKSLVVSFDAERMCITGITVAEVILPVLDFQELNRIAESKKYGVEIDITDLDFQSIKTIKFI